MYRILPIQRVKEELNLPADKSISHRALILSSLVKEKTEIFPLVSSKDIQATFNCLKGLGVEFKLKKNSLLVKGKGLFFPPTGRVYLNAGQSGTTLRILMGLLCAQRFSTFFSAEGSLRKRPMKRITSPLRMMGAKIKAKEIVDEEYPPLLIEPTESLKGIKYRLPVASAQLKSALLLAGLYARGRLEIIEPIISRDHTERMFSLFAIKLEKRKRTIILEKKDPPVSPRELFIPADFSSASFFIVLGLLVKDSQILLKDVNINPTRCGLLRVLKRMKAKIEVYPKKEYYEPYADILVKSSSLCATKIHSYEIPSLIDEVPILCVAASFAKGTTRIYGVKELQVKESNRLEAMIYNLKKLGIGIGVEKFMQGKEEDLLLKIKGPLSKEPLALNFKSFADHRIAMAMVALGKALKEESFLDDVDCIDKSFPEFLSIIEGL